MGLRGSDEAGQQVNILSHHDFRKSS